MPLIKRRIESEAFSLPLNKSIRIPSKAILLNSIPTGIGLVKGRTMLWGNRRMAEIIGYSPEEYSGMDSKLLYESEEEYQRVGKELQESLNLTGNSELETVLKRKDGTLVSCLFQVTALPGTTRNNLSDLRVIVVSDISILKSMQEVLKETNTKYQQIFKNIPAGIFRAAPNNRLIEANNALAVMFNYTSPEEMIHAIKNVQTELFALPGDFDEIKATLDKSTGMHKTELSLQTRDGTIFPAILQIRSVRGNVGSISYYEGIIENISERKQAEEKLQQYQYQLESMIAERTRELDYSLDELSSAKAQLIESERLASLGSLMGGITHEINTPVGVAYTAGTHMQSKVNTIIENFRENRLTKKELENFLNTAEEAVSIINRNLDRAREFITDIKQVAVDQSSEKLRRFNLDEYLKIIVTSLKPVIKRSCADVVIECEPEIIVDSYPGALSQVITNLVMNSIIHGFSGREEGTITIHGEKSDGNTVRISVKDDGVGIEEEIKDRIFDPYFTTKADSGGSGIGLHISASTVKDILNGSISVESKIEKGSVFTIIFPSGMETQA